MCPVYCNRGSMPCCEVGALPPLTRAMVVAIIQARSNVVGALRYAMTFVTIDAHRKLHTFQPYCQFEQNGSLCLGTGSC